ncbi:glycosyltransferase [Reichenbachiella agarivorans]|uniref:Glycosyltransferase n=1 Tax=Reichenbachiella agarivorans TaxID=2979464 RepID=A0ABY6CMZ6_9BACT|nr:glycosyltransferase [Reichenbachiella agarivorans]UXP30848.1 glycosyltransferase [Reichenbachiella agarivorans]
MIVMIYGIHRTGGKSKISHSTIAVTVLLPVRNEEKGIVQTVKSILTNTYQDFELLVLDDHSTDQTVQAIASIADPRVVVIPLAVLEVGKKAAITKGVGLAKGELIVCTDSDTLVTSGWIEGHVRAFQRGNQLSFGPVRYFDQSCLTNMLNVELSALVGVGAATTALGYPSMINGCNYAFAKSAFITVKGFLGNENVASGDDEFLLRKITKRYPGQIAFLVDPAVLVQTAAPDNLLTFYHQRKRWASKWRHHQDWLSHVLPFSLFLIYGILVGASIHLIEEHLWLIGFLLGAKFLADFIFLKQAIKICKNKMNVFSFLSLQIIYPFYVVFFGIASNFGKFQWRNRTYHI